MTEESQTADPNDVSSDQSWNLRLYVAGDSPKSRAAIANLRALCEQYLKVKYKIEVVDLLKDPKLAKTHQIIAIPTLIRELPEPIRRVIGDLSDSNKALVTLDLTRAPTGT
ncbi:MAG TPA: circadian clock KaiB family protein [Polyangiaceae bacterium]|jgi:circadian clock protein KaiB